MSRRRCLDCGAGARRTVARVCPGAAPRAAGHLLEGDSRGPLGRGRLGGGALGVPETPTPLLPRPRSLSAVGLELSRVSLARRERRVSQADSLSASGTDAHSSLLWMWTGEAEVNLGFLLAEETAELFPRSWAACGAWHRKVISFFLSAFHPAFASALMTVTERSWELSSANCSKHHKGEKKFLRNPQESPPPNLAPTLDAKDGEGSHAQSQFYWPRVFFSPLHSSW